MKKRIIEQNLAIDLRKQGKSIKEIAKILKVSQGSVSVWVRHIILTDEQKKILSYRSSKHLLGGRKKGTKTKRRIKMGEEAWEKMQKERIKEKGKKYNSRWWAEKRKLIKQNFVKYKGGCCILCGYDKCIASMDFHHRDPKQKDFVISKHKFSFKTAKKELDKCDLLCRNCHSELHYKLKEKERKIL
jgi:predicted transcriptional regulator